MNPSTLTGMLASVLFFTDESASAFFAPSQPIDCHHRYYRSHLYQLSDEGGAARHASGGTGVSS